MRRLMMLGAGLLALALAAPASAATPTPVPLPISSHPTNPSLPPCSTNADSAYPVICLPAGFHEDQPASLPPGATITFVGQVVDNGPAVSDATVTITLPPQLRITSDDQVTRISYSDLENETDGTPLTCEQADGGAQVTCHTGAIAQGDNFLIAIDVSTTDDATPDTSAPFTVALQPDVADTFPATSVTATINVIAPAHLVVTLNPARAKLVVGHSATIVATIRNAGSGPAPDTVLLALTLPDPPVGPDAHFAITNAPAHGNPVLLDSAHPSRVVRQVHTAKKVTQPPSIGVWPVGLLAPGATNTVPIRVRAVTPGRAVLTVSGLTATTDKNCNDDEAASPDCENFAAAELIAVAAPAITTPHPSRPASDGPGKQPLADTGPHGVPGTLFAGLLAVLAGLVLVRVGRTPARPRRRH